MRNLLLTYNNTTFTVSVDEESYNDITKDMTSLNLYAKLIYEQSFGKKSDDYLKSNVGNEATTSACESEKSQTNSENFRWNDRLIRCLLEIRLAKDNEFNNPVCKKIKLWQKIASEMTEVTGVTVTGEACDIKYRNLLCTYRLNKKKQSKTGEGAIKWEYFHIFDEVLGCKASSLAPPENIADSLDDTSDETQSQNMDNSFSDLESSSSNQIIDRKMKPLQKCKKRQSAMSFQAYLWEKQKREEAREKEIRIREEETSKRQKLMWEEKKALKEKEIDALISLAKAISESKK